MTDEEFAASIDAAFNLEMETSAALRAIAVSVDREYMRMLWTLGYAKGALQSVSVGLGQMSEEV